MKPGPKLTTMQRQELLSAYLKNGFYATRALAESYGVRAKYLAQLARKNGHFRNYSKRDYSQRKPSVLSSRWQKAIERGAVLA